MYQHTRLSSVLTVASLVACMICTVTTPAQTFFDFETPDQLYADPNVSGDVAFFVESGNQAFGGSLRSLQYDGDTPNPFQSFTYDFPFAITAGTVDVWVYDAVGQGFGAFEWGGSVILEDANNPSDFGAVEFNQLPFGGAPGSWRYQASEGSVDRGTANVGFDIDSLPIRATGWHRVTFAINATESLVSVNGSVADDIRAPGSTGTDLRLRFMADTPSLLGYEQWTNSPVGFPAAAERVFFDDVTFTATAPTAQTSTLGFEDDDGSSNPEYDRIGIFMGPPAFNEPNMRGFVNAFSPSTTQARTGTNSAAFTGAVAVFKRIEFDLTNATPGTISLRFYDSRGQDQGFDKVGASFVLQSGTDPSEWISAEVWNAPYPFTGPNGTYYFMTRPPAFGSGFHSGYFQDRAAGWHELTIELTATTSTMRIDGVGADASNSNAVYTGPGLDSNPKFIIMADSVSMGGFNNYYDNAGWTDSETPELDHVYFDNFSEYLYFDDISLPVAPVTPARDWNLFE